MQLSEKGGVHSMQQPLPLSRLERGQEALISSIHAEGELHDRLRDLGFHEGESITCLFSSAFGDPRAYLVRDTVIALRNIDGAKIECILKGGE